VEGIVWFEEGAEAAPGFVGLRAAVGGEFDAVVGDVLVDIAIPWGKLLALSKRTTHEDCGSPNGILFPSDWACLIRMIMRGFPIFLTKVITSNTKYTKETRLCTI
jgi:hypothetical protein